MGLTQYESLIHGQRSYPILALKGLLNTSLNICDFASETLPHNGFRARLHLI
jgi:hypothetical protein